MLLIKGEMKRLEKRGVVMKLICYLASLLLLIGSFMHAGPYNLIVSDPVVSLRVTPTDVNLSQEPDITKSKKIFGPAFERFMQVLPVAYRDPDQNTQLLFNEQVRCLEKLPDGWLKVEALEQYEYNKEKKAWQHICGYIKDSQAIEVKDFQAPDIVIKKPWASVDTDDGKRISVPMGTKFHRLKNMRRVALPNGHTGLINPSDVYSMTNHVNEPEYALRKSIAKTAQKLLGNPYCWGGRSLHTR